MGKIIVVSLRFSVFNSEPLDDSTLYGEIKLKTENRKLETCLSIKAHCNPTIYIQGVAGGLVEKSAYEREAGIGDVFR